MREVFLKSNDSCFSNNVESNLNFNLSTKVRLLPNENLSELFSLNDQYNKERDECNKFRLILGVNPICSNVLYNAKTEVVIDEGSSNVKVIVDNKISGDNSIIKRSEYMDVIRNTEKSHPELGNYTYHCGYNIFNNHMLRNDGFVHVNKEKQLSNNGTYNTIADYLRNSQGEVIKQDIGVKYTSSPEGTNMHLYRFDSIISMRTAFLERCEEIDGWWGFINSSNINIPNRNDETILTNRIINNKKACEFIDLYPDRSLYSFIPKYNKYRKRLEKNWDYCITYPYENDYILIDTVCGGRNGAIRANFHKRYNTNGIEVLQCESYFKHNLKINDYINIYYTDNQGEGVKRVRIETIGDGLGENKDKVFTIKLSDVISILPNENSHFFFKRLSGGDECQYYFRKFKKLKNIDGSDLKSDINKIAFGKNIYGDDTAQIIFTDDINIEGLLDNNKRPLSKVYFTVVKRNAGYKQWYSEDFPEYNSNDIEFSHCFGKVTSGLDFSGIKDEPRNYNVHRLHNLDTAIEETIGKTTLEVWGDAVSSEVLSIEDDITIGKDDFYGDVVEYDIANAKETIISPIYHRVNTAQREVFNENYRDILQDMIVSDDYDSVNGTNSQFKIETYYLNDVVNSTTEWSSSSIASVTQVGEGEKKLIYGNIMPEGNYYNPHFQIDLKYEDDVVSEAPAKLLNTNKISINGDNVVVIEDIPTNYGFYKGDFIAFLYENITKWGEIIKIEENGFKLHVQLDENIEIKNYKAYWSPNNVPIYAKLLPNKRKFTWRKLLNQSELKNTNPLYDMTFSNGRLYIEKNINFFLRRQDPFGKYGLSTPIFNDNDKVYSNPMDDYNIPGSKQTDFSGVIYSINNFDNCY